MDKISIILPVYNAELFLTECLKSIRNQDFKNFEVIMINDCSTDGSSKILEYFASNDERFKLYNNNNNNNGLSKTRNRGISEASGDFIFFVDADDIIDKYCLSKLYKLLVDNDADISISGFQIFEHDIRTSEFDEETNVFDNNSIMKELAICDQIQNFAWGKLYKKDLFNDVQFPIGRVYEDVNTIPLVFSKTQKTVFTNDKLYFYRQNKNSISKTLNLQKVRDFFFRWKRKGDYI